MSSTHPNRFAKQPSTSLNRPSTSVFANKTSQISSIFNQQGRSSMATHSLKRPFSFAGSGFQQKTSNQNKEPLISNSTSPFRNYQRHTITKGFDTPKKALISDNISTKTKSPYKASMTVQEQTEKRMRNELQLITKEFIKVETILNDKTIPF